ncbi:hypothetical protein SEVIR_3G071650v4 [Setaria viridis]
MLRHPDAAAAQAPTDEHRKPPVPVAARRRPSTSPSASPDASWSPLRRLQPRRGTLLFPIGHRGRGKRCWVLGFLERGWNDGSMWHALLLLAASDWRDEGSWLLVLP